MTTRDTQCRAVTRSGTRCTRNAVSAGFCRMHFPAPKQSSLLEHAKTASQVVTTATGVITLIQKAVELWQSLPFGPGPEMPDAFEYLVDEFGPSWSSPASSYSPGNYGATSVNWSEAVDLYEFAKRYVEQEPDGDDHQKQTAELLSVLAERFVDGLPSNFKRMLVEKLGANEEDA